MRYCRPCGVEHPETNEFWYQYTYTSPACKVQSKKRSALRKLGRPQRIAAAKAWARQRTNKPRLRQLRQRIVTYTNRLIRNGDRPGLVKLLGCSSLELKAYLASKFYGDMSWDNYGVVWQVDHIYPRSKMDPTNPEELKKYCHYTNLQPLLTRDNRLKGNKLC